MATVARAFCKASKSVSCFETGYVYVGFLFSAVNQFNRESIYSVEQKSFDFAKLRELAQVSAGSFLFCSITRFNLRWLCFVDGFPTVTFTSGLQLAKNTVSMNNWSWNDSPG